MPETSFAKAKAHFVRGDNYYDHKDFAAAIAEYSYCIDINPHHAKAYNNRGNAYYQQGDFQGAISNYTESLRIDPHSLNAHRNRGQAYYRHGNYNAAIFDYSQYLLIFEEAEIYALRGNCYLHQEKYELAISDYLNAMQDNPNEKALQSLKFILETEDRKMLSKINKKKLFTALEIVAKFSPADAFRYLHQSLDQNTPLGNRFWKRELLLDCNLQSGTLEKICVLLHSLDPSFVIPTVSGGFSNRIWHRISSNLPSRNPQKEEAEQLLNPSTDDQMFKL